ncbi:alpha/beta hydrolase [Oceanisphaera sp. W20_SRM_FM3]|uniref:alpha/beta hydrolase n=1 Tax=Oceanisphaera sp. W20_SRM_FM3 TaxID=3240267 RepID=UPI003F9599FC
MSKIPTSSGAARELVLAKINEIHSEAEGLPVRGRIAFYRRVMDSLSDGMVLASQIRPVTNGEPRGEWVLAPGAISSRRMLYIHGGGWSAGSPKSHRAITDRLSRLARACVFAIDYRLLPEHSYLDGVIDCQHAYCWLRDNGPDGPSAAKFMVIAGDSAGGSHTLALIAWIRDQGLTAPDAALALSPTTDLMLSSLRNPANLDADAMLGPIIKRLAWIPAPILWCGLALTMRALPSNPLVSPLRGDLHHLPPTLIQVSESEALLDSAQQYAAKAQAAGSIVEIETWADMVHVWHIFTPPLLEAEQAFEHIGEFLKRVDTR